MMPPPQGSRSCPGIGSDLARYCLPAMDSVRGQKAAPDSLHGVSCWPSGRAGLGFGSSRGRHGRGADGLGMQVWLQANTGERRGRLATRNAGLFATAQSLGRLNWSLAAMRYAMAMRLREVR